MNYVSAENLTKSYGIKTLFKNISFHINEGDKIAIVAKTAPGKSTLLKIILGKEIADSGEVVINKDVQVVLFDQEIEFESQLTVEEFMMTLDSKPIQALKIIIKSLHSTDQKFIEKALAEMEIHKAWDLETEMKQILFATKITNLEAKMGTFLEDKIKELPLQNSLPKPEQNTDTSC